MLKTAVVGFRRIATTHAFTKTQRTQIISTMTRRFSTEETKKNLQAKSTWQIVRGEVQNFMNGSKQLWANYKELNKLKFKSK